VKRLFAILAVWLGIMVVALPAFAQSSLPEPSRNTSNNADMWKSVRQGAQGYVSIPDKKAGVLVQSEGENWRNWRNGPVSTYGSWALLGMVVLLALFFAIRGRIRVESGMSGHLIVRFHAFERFVHWLTAISFIVLAITGLVILYGRYVLLPIMPPGAFSALAMGSKAAHNYISIAFMVGLVLTFIIWIRWNLPAKADLQWLAKGGGLFTKHSHPPAWKFNAGQKVIFWSVVIGGLALSLTGVALLFPFQWADLQGMQVAQLVHAVIALVMIAIIIAHIYIGTMGMEGAFDAMGTGRVDENWAREHHSLWIDQMYGKKSQPREHPAE
jgi:formate dehydrogenase subunit gamma